MSMQQRENLGKVPWKSEVWRRRGRLRVATIEERAAGLSHFLYSYWRSESKRDAGPRIDRGAIFFDRAATAPSDAKTCFGFPHQVVVRQGGESSITP